jgi:cell division protein FtsX
MDIYTLGKLALPVVVGIMGVAAILTLAMGLFTSLKTLRSLTNVERFFQHLEENRQSSLTINIHSGKRPSQPPMHGHE